ncbi:MAG: HAMP domain-containing protein [Anaerolineales bacterium]|nr:HAMP domain-containing protein [Anaerolineales bacterium]
MFRWLTSGLLLRILSALLIVSVIPITLIYISTQQGYQDTQIKVVDQSQKALDKKAIEGLEARSIILANSVADFLGNRESDLRFLASQTPDAQTYMNFGLAKNGNLWTITSDGRETHFEMPVYQEIVFVDMDGREQIKVSNECQEYPFTCSMVEDDQLQDVSKPANTLYKSETYFSESAKLKSGEVYIGTPIGFHLPPENAYASAQSRSGQRYRGVLRMTAPVIQDGKRIGTLVMAIEMLHLMEFTAHVAPSNPMPQAEIDARESDFSYMINPEGWAISQPRHFNIYGVDENGQPVKGISESDQDQADNLYRPGNLSQMGFIDPAFPELVLRNQKGEDGMLWTTENKRALTYATIPYFSGQYDTPAGFGLMILSTDGARLHIDAEVLSKQFDNKVKSLSQFSLRLITVTLLGVLMLAVLLARTIVAPILRLTNVAKLIEAGQWDKVEIGKLEKIGGGAEVGQLARVFASMTKQVYVRETDLRKQVEGLKIVIDETKRKKAVEEITDSEFFQTLSERALKIRQRQQRFSSRKPNADKS